MPYTFFSPVADENEIDRLINLEVENTSFNVSTDAERDIVGVLLAHVWIREYNGWTTLANQPPSNTQLVAITYFADFSQMLLLA